MIRSLLKKILGIKKYVKYQQFYLMLANFYEDFKLYRKNSLVFGLETIKNKEAAIILDYHSIEKGFLFQEMKPKFARPRIERLNRLLVESEIIDNFNRSQILVAYKVMCKYYELHKEKNIDIQEYFPEEMYVYYRNQLNEKYNESFEGKINFTRNEFYNDTSHSFEKFAPSRKSVRNFTGEKANFENIQKAIELAKTAPSVCNRQASKVYLVEDKAKIDQLLRIQGGMTGYTQNINQLLILTNDRSFYYTIGERNQFYIDGGIFLMNLLYALHFYKIANCPANWGKTMKEDKKVRQIISIPEEEKIICMIPIGVAEETFNVCLSKRREVEEILVKL